MKLQLKTVSILPALLIGAWLLTSCDNGGGGGGGNNNNGGGGDGNSSGSTGTLPAGTKSEAPASGFAVYEEDGIKGCIQFSNDCGAEEFYKRGGKESYTYTIQKEKPTDCNVEYSNIGFDDICYYTEYAPTSGYIVSEMAGMKFCYEVTKYCLDTKSIESLEDNDFHFQKEEPTDCYDFGDYAIESPFIGNANICKTYVYNSGYCIFVEDGEKYCAEYEYIGAGTLAKKACQDEKGTWSVTKPTECIGDTGWCSIGEGEYKVCMKYDDVRGAKEACQSSQAIWSDKKPADCDSMYGKNPNAVKNLKTLLELKNEKVNR